MTVQEFHQNDSTRPVSSWGWRRACLLCTSRARQPTERSGHIRACHGPKGHLRWASPTHKHSCVRSVWPAQTDNRWNSFDELQLKTPLQTPCVWCRLFRYAAAGRPRREGTGGRGQPAHGRGQQSYKEAHSHHHCPHLLCSSGWACPIARHTPASPLGLHMAQGQSLARKTTVFAFSLPQWVGFSVWEEGEPQVWKLPPKIPLLGIYTEHDGGMRPCPGSWAYAATSLHPYSYLGI